jgi:hypothetical protein
MTSLTIGSIREGHFEVQIFRHRLLLQIRWRSSGDTVDKAIKSVPSRRGRIWLLMMSESNLLKMQLVVVMVDAKVLTFMFVR